MVHANAHLNNILGHGNFVTMALLKKTMRFSKMFLIPVFTLTQFG